MYFRLLLVPVLFVAMNTCYANDLDDGIGIDTPINDDLNLGKNVVFIRRKALAKAKAGQSGDGTQSGSCGSGNIVIGAGSKIKEVYNISTNKGTTAVCGK